MIIKFNIFSKLALAHFFGWLVAQFVYVPLGISGDQGGYLSGENTDSLDIFTNRTDFARFFYSKISVIFPGILAALVSTILVAIAIYYSSKYFLPWINLRTFWLANLLPHFLIWSSLASKEAIFIIPSIYLVSFCAKLAYDEPFPGWQIGWYFLILLFMFFMRPTYAIGYGYLLISSLILSSNFSLKIKQVNSIKRFSNSSAIILFFIFFCVVSFILYQYIFDNQSSAYAYMSSFQSYFLSYDGNTNRSNIEWNSVASFFSNMPLGIPFSIIGFTPAEALENVKYLPAFLEGIIAFLFLIWLLIKLIGRAKVDLNVRSALYLCFLPALFIMILAHYPLGIFNPGSAIRYKQSLAPAFYFYPLYLLSLHIKNRNYFSTQNTFASSQQLPKPSIALTHSS